MNLERVSKLMEQANQGFETAMRALVEEVQADLLERIRLMMGDKARRVAESGDFLHGVVVEMLRDTPRREITDERELLRWLTAVARNNIRDEVRRAREDVLQRLSTSLDVRGGRPGSEERPSRLLVQAEAAERLISALEKLDESDRRVIELRDFEDLSWSEVARALDRSEESARKLHGRALVRLGRGLKQA